MIVVDRLVGKVAPDFTVECLAADGKNFESVSLKDYQGSWLVMFFYPMDFTFVCPTELTAFADKLPQFKEMDAQLLSVSTDSVYTHLAWTENGLGKLGYPMAADQNLAVSIDYGVLLEDDGIALRGLYIIDPDQKIRYSVIQDNDIGRNPDEILRVLAALKTGGLCGANWTAGESNLIIEQPEEASSEQEISGMKNDQSVRIYSSPGCSYCQSTKDFLKKAGVAYEEIDLSTSKEGQAFMESHGYTRLPVTVINGQEIVGFHLAEVKAALS